MTFVNYAYLIRESLPIILLNFSALLTIYLCMYPYLLSFFLFLTQTNRAMTIKGYASMNGWKIIAPKKNAGEGSATTSTISNISSLKRL